MSSPTNFKYIIKIGISIMKKKVSILSIAITDISIEMYWQSFISNKIKYVFKGNLPGKLLKNPAPSQKKTYKSYFWSSTYVIYIRVYSTKTQTRTTYLSKNLNIRPFTKRRWNFEERFQRHCVSRDTRHVVTAFGLSSKKEGGASSLPNYEVGVILKKV